MKEWRKIGYLAEGIIYACGNKRRISIPGNRDIYYEVTNHEGWHSITGTDSGNGQRKARLK